MAPFTDREALTLTTRKAAKSLNTGPSPAVQDASMARPAASRFFRFTDQQTVTPFDSNSGTTDGYDHHPEFNQVKYASNGEPDVRSRLLELPANRECLAEGCRLVSLTLSSSAQLDRGQRYAAARAKTAT